MLDVITRRSNLELMLQIGAEVLVSEDPRHRGDHPVNNKLFIFTAAKFHPQHYLCCRAREREAQSGYGIPDCLPSH